MHVVAWILPSMRRVVATFVNTILEWLSANASMLAWGVGIFVVSLGLTAVLLRAFVVRLEPDYFVISREELRRRRADTSSAGRIAKNVAGVLLIVAGLVMLVLPGQGVLTVLIGLLLTDFPGKRSVEKRIVQRPQILALLNRMRAKQGKQPLRVE